MSLNYWQENYRRYTAADPGDGWLRAHAREILPGMDVLDLGCGAGANIPDLLSLGANVTAADFSPEAIASLQGCFGEQLSRSDCFDMRNGFPYEAAGFDAVIADLSLHYFSRQDTRKIIGEIARVLKRGGRLIARVHSTKNLPDVPAEQIEDHYYFVDGCARRYFTPEEICTLFSDWAIEALAEKQIQRYGRTKHILELIACR